MLRIYLWALSYLRPYKGRLALVILSGLLITSSELIIPKFIQYLIDTVLPQQDGRTLRNILLVMVGIVIVMVAVRAVRNLVQRQLIENASKDSQFAAFQQLRHLGFAYFESHSVGETLSFMNTQSQAVQKIYNQYLPQMIEQTIFALVSLIFMTRLSWHLVLLVIPCFLLYYLWGPKFEEKANVNGRTAGHRLRALNQKVYESMAAMSEIRAYAREDWDQKRFRDSFESLHTVYMKYTKYAYLRGSFRRLTYYVGAIGVFLYGAILVEQQQLATGAFIAFILYYFSAMHILTSIITAMTEQKLLIYQIEPLYQFMQRVPQVVEPATPTVLPSVRGDIAFTNVTFGYPDRSHVLQGFDLQIHTGQRVAIVGRSGGGKSTLLKLIGRFYDPQAGTITLDGVPLMELSFEQLRNSIGFVFQETYLFNTTIKENIRFGNPQATDDEVVEAAKMAYCHEFIMELEDGYDTKVGERGFKLSGGQKQRLSIARLLIKKPTIVLLDEATSALDNISEREVKSALDRLLVGRTVVTIAHRLSTIKDYDQIVYLDQGKNVEMGSYEELMSQRGSFYQLAVGLHEEEEVLV